MGTILDLTNGATALIRRSSRTSAPPEQRPSQQPPALPRPSRELLEQELKTLRTREVAVLRQLARHDHPELASELDELSARLEAAEQARAQFAQGPSQEDVEKRAALERKLSVLREQRAEVDAKIEAMTMQLFELNVAEERARSTAYADALGQLREAAERVEPKLTAAHLGLSALFPNLAPLLADKPEQQTFSATFSLELVSEEEAEETLARAIQLPVPAR